MKGQDMFDKFMLYAPTIAAKVVSWDVTGAFEITAVLNDGTMVAYDDTCNSIRNLRNIQDPTEEDRRRDFSSSMNRRLDWKYMTQKELAQITGISEQTISKYSKAKATPSLHNALKISEALNCSIEELISD